MPTRPALTKPTFALGVLVGAIDGSSLTKSAIFAGALRAMSTAPITVLSCGAW